MSHAILNEQQNNPVRDACNTVLGFWCVAQGVARKPIKKQVKSTPKKVADPLYPAKKKNFRIGRDIQVP